jgi:hypothetical protein
MTTLQTKKGEHLESPAHIVLGLVAALMAAVIGGIAYVSVGSGVPAVAGFGPNSVAAASQQQGDPAAAGR